MSVPIKDPSKTNLTEKQLEDWANAHPELAQRLARMSPEFRAMRDTVGQTEARLSSERQMGLLMNNINPDYADYFKFHHKYAPRFQALVVGTVDNMYLKVGRLKGLYKMVHPPRRYPPWFIGLMVFGVMTGLYFIVNPEAGFELAGWLSQSNGPVSNSAYVILLLAVVAALIYFAVRRRNRPQ